MSAAERIIAALDEAEKRLDAASIPWSVAGTDGTAVDQAGPGAYIARTNQQADATLIVSVVNRERAQIQHARDVLARHVEAVHDVRDSCHNHGSGCCAGCGKFDVGTHRYTVSDCPEVVSLLAVWCPEPTP